MGELNMLNDYMSNGWIATYMAVWRIFQIIFYLLSAWWLYNINKKFWEKYAWLSFVPILQLYSYTTAWQKPIKQYIIYPLIWLIVWTILWIVTFWITIIIAIIYMLVMIIKLYHAISLRCGRWAWTTIWLLLIPFIMFPIVWYKLADKSSQTQDWVIEIEASNNIVTETTTHTETKPEQKIEL